MRAPTFGTEARQFNDRPLAANCHGASAVVKG
jgi:hypothetical protein